MIKEIGIMTSAAVLSIGGIMGVSMARTDDKTAPVTPATDYHGLPGAGGANPGWGGSSASPGGNGAGGGNGIHNIAGGAPGWDGTSAADGAEPPACEMHGGFANGAGDDKKNCD